MADFDRSLDELSRESWRRKRERRRKKRKNYASIRENIILFHLERKFKSRRVVSSGDARRLTRRKWCESTSEPAPTYIDARATNPGRRLNPGPLLLAPARATLPSFLPPDRSSPVNYPSFCHSADNAFR